VSAASFLGLALQRDDDLGGLVVFFLLFVLPLLLRLLRWLGERAGLLRPKPGGVEEGEDEGDPREALRRRRAEREAAEAEGEELWKRLARGETAAPPRPTPTPASAEPREASLEWELEEEPGEVAEESLEREEEPTPLAALGEVRETAPSEVSLETEEAPLPLAALTRDVSLSTPSEPPGRLPAAHRFGALDRDDWRRAIVLSEVLGPPVSERLRA
jgi:hypothetical protein